MGSREQKIAILKKHVSEYPDFPKPGILFRDFFSIFQDPQATKVLVELLVSTTRDIKPAVECIVGLDARGFLIGPLIATELKLPFVPVRKKGKLPGKTHSVTYSLEYGTDTLEIQVGSIKKGQNVLIVDDLLATGGSLKASTQLVEKLEAKVAACLVVMELVELKGRSKLNCNVLSLLEY